MSNMTKEWLRQEIAALKATVAVLEIMLKKMEGEQ